MLRLPPPTHQPTTHTHMRRAPTRLKSLFLRPRLPPPTFSSITCFSVDSASTSASFRLSSLRNDSWKEREEEREKGWEDRRSHRVKRVCKAVPLVPTPSPAAGRDTCTPPPTSHLAMPCPPHHPHPNCPWPASAAAHAAAPVPDSQAGKQAGGRPGKQAGGRPGAQAGAPPPPPIPAPPPAARSVPLLIPSLWPWPGTSQRCRRGRCGSCMRAAGGGGGGGGELVGGGWGMGGWVGVGWGKPKIPECLVALEQRVGGWGGPGPSPACVPTPRRCQQQRQAT